MNTLNTIRKILLAYILLQTFSYGAFSQEKAVKTVPSGRNAEKIVTEENLRAGIEFLADTTFGGRATGSKGACEASMWIGRHFRDAG